jgi:hypothetical protein
MGQIRHGSATTRPPPERHSAWSRPATSIRCYQTLFWSTLNTRTIEDAQTCLSAFLILLDTMHGVPRLNLPAAEGVGRQNYQF